MNGCGRLQFLGSHPVSRETMARLDAFESELTRWNGVINLVSTTSLVDVWRRHMSDSAQLLPLAPKDALTWVDLGSGGGFPGLVVAALAHEQASKLHVTLIESDARKCAFLASAARAMALNVTIEHRRIERPPLRRYDVVSARALAPLAELVILAEPYMAEKGLALFPKGANVDAELTEVVRKRHIEMMRSPSISDPRGVILQFRRV